MHDNQNISMENNICSPSFLSILELFKAPNSNEHNSQILKPKFINNKISNECCIDKKKQDIN